MRAQGSNYSFAGQAIYIGLDVHKNSWSVEILTESGYKERFSQESKADILAAHLRKHYKGATYYSVYESGFTGFSTHYSLTSLGINNIIVNASDVPCSQKEKLNKSDKVDAGRLARALKNGELRGIYILSEEELEFREEVRYRHTIVKENTRWKNRIKCYLYSHGIDYPETFKARGTHWSGRFVDWLKEESNTSPSLLHIINSYTSVRRDLAAIEKYLRNFSQKEKHLRSIELLMSIPGIGPITAITFLSEIGNVERFKNERAFASFIGIVPTCHNSGEKESTGGMTFRGNNHLTRVLIEASWTAVRNDIALSACFGELCKRMGHNDAIIRIARKLSNRILAVLKKNEKYVFAKNNQ